MSRAQVFGVGLGALLGLLLGSMPPSAAAPPTPDPVREAAFTVESIEIDGNERTSRETTLLYFPLREGDAVRPEDIVGAVASLRESELFAKVEIETRPGSERGQLRVRLAVEEKGVELRFGTGYRDLDGWYLIPAQLRFDNRLGRGERTRLQVRAGYRVAGLELLIREPRFGDGLNFWGADLAAHALSRPYFLDGIEYEHRVSRATFGAHGGRRLATWWRWEIGVRHETVDADSVPEAREDDDFREVKKGDELPFGELPGSIARHVGETRRTIGHVEIVYDSRSSRRLASTPVSGVWGRVRGEGYLREGAEIGSVTADLRAYRRVLGGVLTARARGGAIGRAAAFYDRFHLGGLYTVRGVPSQSLSPPGGDTRFWTATLEFRAPMAGGVANPRLAGVLFVDAGDGWVGSDARLEDTAVSAGWGFRVRVPWLDSLGVDFGVPLTDMPTTGSFHANAALGWNF